jgi:hypothetical protein
MTAAAFQVREMPPPTLTIMTKATFILANVVPHNAENGCAESCCYILGKALFWYILSYGIKEIRVN